MTTVTIQMTPSPMITSMPLTMNVWSSSTSPIARLIRSPVRCALEVAEALGLELVVDAVAELEDEFLGDAVEEVGLDRSEHFADDVDHEEPDDGGKDEDVGVMDAAVEGGQP